KLLLTHVNDTDAKYLLESVEKLAVTGNLEDLLRKLSGVGSEEAEHEMCVGCRCVNSRWYGKRWKERIPIKVDNPIVGLIGYFTIAAFNEIIDKAIEEEKLGMELT
ncbi:hypothetical protein Tco_1520262, partial [Tanacetum coccineum]